MKIHPLFEKALHSSKAEDTKAWTDAGKPVVDIDDATIRSAREAMLLLDHKEAAIKAREMIRNEALEEAAKLVENYVVHREDRAVVLDRIKKLKHG